MSFLAGRLAGKEGAYFYQESKQVVSRFVEKHKITPTNQPNLDHIQSPLSKSDVLPEVLKHSLPLNISHYHHPSPPSNNPTIAVPKWVLSTPSSGSSSDSEYAYSEAINPLRAYISLPQVTLGPKRWNMPYVPNSGLASTANELRRDRYNTPISPEKLKAIQEGLSQIGKAFFVATLAIFGGGALMIGLVFSKLELRSSCDIQTKGRDLVRPKYDMLKEKLGPARTWAKNMSKRWQIEKEQGVKDKPIIIQELSKVLGAKSSSY